MLGASFHRLHPCQALTSRSAPTGRLIPWSLPIRSLSPAAKQRWETFPEFAHNAVTTRY